jgi:hypothetical protein
MSKAYADKEKNICIDNPCVNLFGTGTSGALYDCITKENFLDGFLGRMLWIDCGDKMPRKMTPVKSNVPPGIIKRAKAWGGLFLEREFGEGDKRKPIVCQYSKDAELAQYTFNEECEDKVEACQVAGKPELTAVWARAAERASTLAMIAACSDWRPPEPGEAPSGANLPRVTEVNYLWAAGIARWQAEFMGYVVETHISENSFDKMQKKVLASIVKAEERYAADDSWVPQNWVNKKNGELSEYDRTRVLQNLEATGRLQRKVKNGANKYRTIRR